MNIRARLANRKAWKAFRAELVRPGTPAPEFNGAWRDQPSRAHQLGQRPSVTFGNSRVHAEMREPEANG